MVTVHIDLPLFSSPTEAVGYFGGLVCLEALPERGRPFPWPAAWTAQFGELLRAQAHQVWSISAWPHHASASCSVTLYGLVCDGRDEAAALARHLERCTGIPFDAHDPV